MLNYQDYLASREWGRLRNEAMSAAEWRCQICGTHSSKTILEAHHRDYKRMGKPGELKDVVALCKRCHELFHGIIATQETEKETNDGIT